MVGPHPFPTIVRSLQSIIGIEARDQMISQAGRLPKAVIACVGGGSNAAGIFSGFLDDADVNLIGIEAGGHGLQPGQHAAPLSHGMPGVLHGARSYVLQDEDGQTAEVHSCSAGLDYPGVGPEHAHWMDTGRVKYDMVTDEEALEAFQRLSSLEGILPALETAHAIAGAMQIASSMTPEDAVLVNLSGRGDKDVVEARSLLDGEDA